MHEWREGGREEDKEGMGAGKAGRRMDAWTRIGRFGERDGRKGTAGPGRS